MVLVHLNTSGSITACYMPKYAVHRTNLLANVTCPQCIATEEYSRKKSAHMKACPACDTPLPEGHPAFLMTYLQDWVQEQGGWHIFESSKYVKGATFTVNGRTAKIADIKDTYDSGDIDVEGYYGESALPQGSTFNGYIVIKIGDSYFKKTGTGDSYGEMSWDGDLKRVAPTVKTIEVFE